MKLRALILLLVSRLRSRIAARDRMKTATITMLAIVCAALASFSARADQGEWLRHCHGWPDDKLKSNGLECQELPMTSGYGPWMGGCSHEKGISFDVKIAGCTELIGMHKFDGMKLADIYFNRGMAYHNTDRLELAIADYNHALEAFRHFPEALNARGQAYSGTGRYELAMADLDEAIREAPDFAPAFNNRCWTRAIWNKDLEAALADCNEALRLAPAMAAFMDSRGLVRFRMGDYAAALEDYEAAHKANPQSASSLYMRGLTRLRLGRGSEANADLAAAAAIDPKVAETYAGYGVKP